LEEVAVHGLCHLAGYDHKDARAFASMKRRETSLLGRSGMPRHFADTL
jgi:ssRNA-specific RNase YbeY (16S rRNA maturation enzyme)